MNKNKEPVDFYDNSLNTIKIFAAIQVMYIHAIRHLKISLPDFLIVPFDWFRGVPIFFAISGFLIWGSIARTNDWKVYSRKRIFRIYPELWAAVLLEIVAILIVYKEKIQWLQLLLMATIQGTIAQSWGPSFLEGYGCGYPNGSLWTMGIILQFYILAWFAYKYLHKKNKWIWIILFLFSLLPPIAYSFASANISSAIVSLYDRTVINYAWIFILGMMISEFYESTIAILKKIWPILLLVSIGVAIIGFDLAKDDYGIVMYSTLIMAVIGFAYCFPKINIKFDVSYGIYLYHMVLINVMIELGFVNNVVYLILAMVCSIILSSISLIIYKQISLLLKNRKGLNKLYE